MKNNIDLYLLFFTCVYSFSQEPIQKNYESFDLFLTEQKSNIAKLENGLTSDEVKEIMGVPVVVNIPKVGKMKALHQLFKQPEYINVYKNNPKLIVDILWYFSTPKDQNGFISKSECTPLIFENDVLVGKGWEFFKTYRRTGKLR